MSVSALDRPVSNPPPRPLPPKPELKSKDVSPSLVSGQKADRVSFNSSDDKPGKVFAAHASTTKERADGNASQGSSRQSAASDTQPPGFFDKFKQNLKGWCGGQRPPKPDPCPPAPCNAKPPERPTPCKPDPCNGKPPERPTPCKPDPCNSKPPERPTPCKPEPCRYERNDELARELLDNFDAFRDSSGRPYITKQDIERVAGQRPTGNEATDKNIRLARALLQRPELIQAIDRHSTTGALDDIIDRRKIEMTLGSQSPMKYLDDKQLANEMLDQFKALRDPDNLDYISIDKLRGVAQWPTDDPTHGHLAWIAQEILKRSDTLAALDGGDHWGKDGWIHKDTLRQMAR